MKGITVKRRFHVRRGSRNQRQVRYGAKSAVVGRVPRFFGLWALATCLNQVFGNGVLTNQADLARQGRVSRARITQIIGLLNLAPAVQLELLELAGPLGDRRTITERNMRAIGKILGWCTQLSKLRELQRSVTVTDVHPLPP